MKEKLDRQQEEAAAAPSELKAIEVKGGNAGGGGSPELSDDDLDKVAGGMGDPAQGMNKLLSNHLK